MNTEKGLHIIHLNIRSLPSKIDHLKAWVVYNKPSVITLSETWLHSNILDSEIKLDYVLYRADRGPRGGGVATYVSSHLCSELIIPTVSPLHFECLFIKLILKNKHLTIGNIYRPPNSPSESTDCILSTLDSLDHPGEMIILGDFNKKWLERISLKDKNSFHSMNLTKNY